MGHSAKYLIVCIALAGTALFGAHCGDSGSTPQSPSDAAAPQPADGGGESAATTVTLAIEGMHCQGCVTAITGKVQTLDGVRQVRVSLPDEAAWVTLNRPQQVDTVIQAIDSLGYKATVADGAPVTTSATVD